MGIIEARQIVWEAVESQKRLGARLLVRIYAVDAGRMCLDVICPSFGCGVENTKQLQGVGGS